MAILLQNKNKPRYHDNRFCVALLECISPAMFSPERPARLPNDEEAIIDFGRADMIRFVGDSLIIGSLKKTKYECFLFVYLQIHCTWFFILNFLTLIAAKASIGIISLTRLITVANFVVSVDLFLQIGPFPIFHVDKFSRMSVFIFLR